MVDRICQRKACGRYFKAPAYEIQRGRGKYCCKSCSNSDIMKKRWGATHRLPNDIDLCDNISISRLILFDDEFDFKEYKNIL